jgi:outer membrane scaffolding protein for murein synthesis (MipA/OmpV family)
MKSRIASALAGVLALLCCARAQAEDLPLYEIGGGVTLLGFPDYRGSDHYNFSALPLPFIIYRGERVRVTREGIMARLLQRYRLSLDLSLAVSLPGNSDDADSPRAGMPDLLPTWELGPSLDYWLTPRNPGAWNWRLRLPVRGVMASDAREFEGIGWLTYPHVQAARRLQWGDWQVRLSAAAGTLWATRKYHEYFYSVEERFATPTRPAYDADGGYSGARASVYCSFNKGRWNFGIGVQGDWLGEAAFVDSPLVETHGAAVFGVGVGYRFLTSDKTVVDDEAF